MHKKGYIPKNYEICMDKIKLIYSLMIIILYIPLVFLGANVFFPKYSGVDSYYGYNDCYAPQQVSEKAIVNNTEYQKCIQDQNLKQTQFQKEKNAYESKKYIAITIFNLIILILTLFLVLDNSLLLGLFIGSTVTTFVATLMFFNTNSKLGFTVLVIIFITTIYVINKYKDKFLKSK